MNSNVQWSSKLYEGNCTPEYIQKVIQLFWMNFYYINFHKKSMQLRINTKTNTNEFYNIEVSAKEKIFLSKAI